jgi:DNA polymerase I-like protein with 3'-5' exonuclease and polymerase domains
MNSLSFSTGDISRQFFNETKDSIHWSCDIETDGLNVLEGAKAHVLTLWCERQKRGVYVRLTPTFPVYIAALFGMAGKQFLFHYAGFDIPFLYKAYRIFPSDVFDTKIAAKIIDPQRTDGSQSLKALLERYGVASIEKPSEVQQGDWASEPTEAMIRYAQEDVQYLWKLHESQMYMMRHDQMVAYTRSRKRVPELAAEYIDYEGGLHGH